MKAGVLAAGLTLAGLAVVLAWPDEEAPADRVSLAAVAPSPEVWRGELPSAQAASGAGPVALRPDPAFARWVAERSVLRGTALDGGWGLDAQGRLQPSLALRRRFDHLLQLQGQAPLPEISAYLVALARQDLDAAATQAVVQVWQAYLGLQAAPRSTVVRPDDAQSLAAALAEHQQLRRQWLGPAWAHAFYGEEEAALAARLAQGLAAAPPAAPLIDRSALDAAALQRLQAEEADQARWMQRLAEAREAVGRLRSAPELSPPQREQALAALLEERFAPGGERLRARALLGLP